METLAAIPASAVKIYGMAFDLAVKIPGGDLVKIYPFHVEISDAAAFTADKMIMRGSVRIKMIHAVADMNSGYFSNVCQ